MNEVRIYNKRKVVLRSFWKYPTNSYLDIAKQQKQIDECVKLEEEIKLRSTCPLCVLATGL